jgi:hypothetical protein
MDQADISRLESREIFDDCQVSTLQRYISALGGRLELVAAFGNKKIVVAGVHAGPVGATPANRRMQPPRRKTARG